MTRPLQYLFEPVTVGQRMAKNRIVSAAHNTNLDRRGRLTQGYADYIVRRARGGPGMVICFGAANVHEACGAFQRRVSLWDEANEEFLSEIAERAHQEECLVLSQAAHIGRRGDSSQSGRALQAPSAIPEPVHLEIPHALGEAEIPPIVASFANAARRLERCGWDGIEITSYAGQLLEQFWSPRVNRRTDAYGGDLAGRMRLSVDVVGAVRAAVSERFIVGLRMTGDPGAAREELGLDREDMMTIAGELAKLGSIDLFHISGSSGATKEGHAGVVPPATYGAGCYLPLARRMKELLPVPVIGTGRVLTVEQAEMALAGGDCDLVGMVRALIADPDLPSKAKAGLRDRIRPCVSIISGCSGRTGRGNTLGCSVNPAIASPALESHLRALEKQTVAVVGGGPAGLEAARVSAIRGHEVMMFEKHTVLGGQLLTAARAPGRHELLEYVGWLVAEIDRHGVERRVGAECSVEQVLGIEPGVVVVATGSVSTVPELADELPVQCCSDVDVLDGSVSIAPGSNALVYDIEGGYRGGSIANVVAEAGAGRVELATHMGMVCQELDKLQQPAMYRTLSRNMVVWSPNVTLGLSSNGELSLRNHWSGVERSVAEMDLIVYVGYREAKATFYASLREARPSLVMHQVGDCLAPRQLIDATADGIRAGNAA